MLFADRVEGVWKIAVEEQNNQNNYKETCRKMKRVSTTFVLYSFLSL